MNFYTRLEQHLKSLNPPKTFYELQWDARMSASRFTEWKTGKRLPSDNELEKLANCKDLGLKISTLQAWKMIDKFGETATAEAAKLMAQTQWNQLDTDSQANIMEVVYYLKQNSLIATENQPKEHILPIIGLVDAGRLTICDGDKVETIEWTTTTAVPLHNAGVLKVHGDSLNPPILDGSYLLVTEEHPEGVINGKTYVIITEPDNLVLMRVSVLSSGEWELTPYNPEKPTIKIEPSSVKRLWRVLESKQVFS